MVSAGVPSKLILCTWNVPTSPFNRLCLAFRGYPREASRKNEVSPHSDTRAGAVPCANSRSMPVMLWLLGTKTQLRQVVEVQGHRVSFVLIPHLSSSSIYRFQPNTQTFTALPTTPCRSTALPRIASSLSTQTNIKQDAFRKHFK